MKAFVFSFIPLLAFIWISFILAGDGVAFGDFGALFAGTGAIIVSVGSLIVYGFSFWAIRRKRDITIPEALGLSIVLSFLGVVVMWVIVWIGFATVLYLSGLGMSR